MPEPPNKFALPAAGSKAAEKTRQVAVAAQSFTETSLSVREPLLPDVDMFSLMVDYSPLFEKAPFQSKQQASYPTLSVYPRWPALKPKYFRYRLLQRTEEKSRILSSKNAAGYPVLAAGQAVGSPEHRAVYRAD